MSVAEYAELEFPWGEGAAIAVAHNFWPMDLIEKLYLLAYDACDAIGAPGKTVSGVLPVKRSIDVQLSAWEYQGEWSAESLLGLGYDVKQMDADFAEGVGRVVDSYNRVINTGTDRFKDTGYQIQRYTKNEGFYKPHVDGNAAVAQERLISIVLYLNTVEVGGETGFPRHGVKVKAVQGDAAVFPSHFAFQHEGCMPVSDDKYIINTFIEPIEPSRPDPNSERRTYV